MNIKWRSKQLLQALPTDKKFSILDVELPDIDKKARGGLFSELAAKKYIKRVGKVQRPGGAFSNVWEMTDLGRRAVE